MKTWIAFVAGGLFALALIVTCGRGSGGPAHAAGGTIWQYAFVLGSSALMPTGVAAPAGLTSCRDDTCSLNTMGADGWELVQIDLSNGYFILKRPQ